MKKYFFLISSGLLLLTLYSCKKSSTDPGPTTTFSFPTTLSGANEVPANTSTAAGSVTGSYDSLTKILTITVSFSGLAPTAGHIHKAAAGTAGPVLFPFPAVSTSPFTFSTAALTAAQQADLFASLYYVNLHTTAFPGGEIRGQLIKQ